MDMNTYMKKRYHARRKLALDHLGNKCVECESTMELHFHHVDPSTKLYTIAKASSFSEERFWTEVNKCELLCNDCHVAHHASQYQCGTPQKYWRECNCAKRTTANTEYNRDYKRRRKEHLDSNI
jgi:hypothetical protein